MTYVEKNETAAADDQVADVAEVGQPDDAVSGTEEGEQGEVAEADVDAGGDAEGGVGGGGVETEAGSDGGGAEADDDGASGTARPQRLQDFLERTMHVQTVEEAEALIARAVQAGLRPGHMALVEMKLAEALDVPRGVITGLTRDHKNMVNGECISSTDSAAAALIKFMGDSYAHAVYCGGTLYTYSKDNPDNPAETGFYQGNGDEEIDDHILDAFGHTSAGKTRALRSEIKDRAMTHFKAPAFFDDAPAGLNMANGFLVLNRAEKRTILKKCNPRFKARFRLDVAFDRNAKAETFLAALARTLGDPEKIAALQEIFGAVLFRVRPPKDAARAMFVLFGPRNTGKSTLISILMGLVPEYATCSVPPEEWNHQYNRAHLDGKLLNVVTELGGGRIVGGDHLKRIVSGEMVSARHPHGKTFHFTAAAFHLFAANELPRVTDRTTAFERRVLALSFDRSLEPGEIDGDFMARIEAERAGIVNWAAEGAIRLLERGRFTIPRGHLEAVLTMQFGQDPVEHFVHLCVERAPDSKVSTADLRNALKAFGDDRGFEMSHARSLAGRLKEVHGAERFKVQGRPHYRGIRLKAAPSA